MKYAFLFDGFGVIVKHWAETPDKPEERGTRVEIQRLDAPPPKAFWYAQEQSLRQPLFRADLFTRDAGPPGNWESAHYHPNFLENWEPSDRAWDASLTNNPTDWMRSQFLSMREVLRRGGAPDLAQKVDESEVNKALPQMMAAVEACYKA
jgi:hypothetical protein